MNSDAVEQIVSAIANAKRVDESELDVHLEHHVATEAIRDLVDHDGTSWRLQFETPEHVVGVQGNGTIFVDGERRPASF